MNNVYCYYVRWPTTRSGLAASKPVATPLWKHTSSSLAPSGALCIFKLHPSFIRFSQPTRKTRKTSGVSTRYCSALLSVELFFRAVYCCLLACFTTCVTSMLYPRYAFSRVNCQLLCKCVVWSALWSVVRCTQLQVGRPVFAVASPSSWNCLPNNIRIQDKFSAFKSPLKSRLFPISNSF